jgi:hypothetical protein
VLATVRILRNQSVLLTSSKLETQSAALSHMTPARQHYSAFQDRSVFHPVGWLRNSNLTPNVTPHPPLQPSPLKLVRGSPLRDPPMLFATLVPSFSLDILPKEDWQNYLCLILYATTEPRDDIVNYESPSENKFTVLLGLLLVLCFQL